jgi:hypothetical protein
VDGVLYAVQRGNTIMSDHPLAIAQAHTGWFVPATSRVTFPSPPRPPDMQGAGTGTAFDATVETSVEQATRAPGERRNR